MKYGELVQFEPIQTTIQLLHANKADRARRLVETYVISDEMAGRLKDTVVRQLRFDRPADNKGLLVVGNYGTGKSHLMAVMSSIAESDALVQSLRHPALAQECAPIAGKFVVIRTELGSTTMDFREFVCSELEAGLGSLGITYRFPARDKISNHKAAFEDMMAAFHDRYPDKGILLVVDELLDYLRARSNDQLRILDLNFLREIGEICGNLRFRFVAGVQEALFDSPRLQFAADTVRRVKDRFEQVTIARRDVKFVVAERLLSKTPGQRAQIREILQPFTRFYTDMNERLDEYVSLFPVHPNYIDTFDRLSVVEKREVLRSLSVAMNRLLDTDVPTDTPGLLAYDSYWKALSEDPSFRSISEVRTVLDVSRSLAGRVEQSYTRPAYKEMALRLVSALSVQRLTTGSVDTPIGLTPRELRDGLCLFHPAVKELGGDPADDLLTLVQTALREIIRTVNGQFITHNRHNDQYFLDVHKDIDYDAEIEKRADTLGGNELDRYYFALLRRALECEDDTYVPGFSIWEDELEWTSHRTTRKGYLFFGSPNERSTAVPPRDFYLYFLQPHDQPSFVDERRADEVFFRLVNVDNDWTQTLRLYAAAMEQSLSASGSARDAYAGRARDYLKRLTTWLQEHLLGAVVVTYQGSEKTLREYLKSHDPRATTREMIHRAASACLEPCFAEQAPEYPVFSVLITGANRKQAVQDALRAIGGQLRTRTASAVLDALELLDGERIVPGRSRYARHVIELLRQKPTGKSLTRDELIQTVRDVEFFVPERFRLEPEWLLVILAALAHSGDAVTTVSGRELGVSNLGAFVSSSLQDLVDFTSVKRPRDWDVAALRALFELLGLPPGWAQQVTQNDDESVRALHTAAAALVEDAVKMQSRVSRILFWGQPVLSAAEIERAHTQLSSLKGFLDSLQSLDSPAKLKNLKVTAEDVRTHDSEVAAIRELANVAELAAELDSHGSYLHAAETCLPSDHPWCADARVARNAAVALLQDPEKRTATDTRQRLLHELTGLKKAYADTYLALHRKARLGVDEEKKRTALLNDPRLETLRQMATIKLLPLSELTTLEHQLGSLTPCSSLTETDAGRAPVCPHCDYRPAAEGTPRGDAAALLSAADDRIDALVEAWTASLLTNLEDPTTQAQLELLSAQHRKRIDSFLKKRVLPASIDRDFIQAVEEALKGLTKVVLRMGDLKAAIQPGGSPATIKDMKRRFDDFLVDATKGKDPSKVRIVLE